LADVGEDCSTAYYRARYYNPISGRFLSRDPEAGRPVDPKTLHKYLYAGGDPVNRIDPSGRDDLLEWVALGVDSAMKINVLSRYDQCLAEQAFFMIDKILGETSTDPAAASNDSQGVGKDTIDCLQVLLKGLTSPIPSSLVYNPKFF
jgi:RHS repeat-associated protein